MLGGIFTLIWEFFMMLLSFIFSLGQDLLFGWVSTLPTIFSAFQSSTGLGLVYIGTALIEFSITLVFLILVIFIFKNITRGKYSIKKFVIMPVVSIGLGIIVYIAGRNAFMLNNTINVYALEPFNNIYFDTKGIDVVIQQGNEYRLDFTSNRPVSFSSTNEDLVVIYSHSPHTNISILNQLLTGFTVNDAITLTIPTNTSFDEVKLKINGRGIFDIDTLNANEIEVEVGSGTINIDSLKANKLDVNFISGDILINTLATNDFYIEGGSGTFTANGAVADNLNIDTSSSDVQISNIQVNDTTALVGSGSLSLQGDFSGDINLSVSSGKAKLSFTNHQDYYDYLFSSRSSGSIFLNEQKMEDANQLSGNKPVVDISVGSGNVSILTK